MKNFFKIILIAAIISACHSNNEKQTSNTSIHKVEVLEALQAGEYTYLRVQEGDIENWLAVPALDAQIGNIYYYEGGMEMLNFKSKQLNRTFAKVYFLEKISAEPITTEKTTSVKPTMSTPQKPQLVKQEIKIEPVKGGITIAELFKNKASYAGKIVKITGKVTKFNPAIMDKNWIHLQDGTADNGDFDLTVTSKLEAEEGDILIVEGKITLDKDFGAGYFYKVIMEDASLAK